MVTELVVPLPCGTLRERGSKLARASPRVVRAGTLSLLGSGGIAGAMPMAVNYALPSSHTISRNA
ncbi:MAG: hypothetical protein V7K48_05650 [Nostoc sp.]|uniref:hypothetical protein n=1 Tax=Nostoc sp. TaxID=1180 RepID=UPI002FFB34EE